MAKSNVYRGEHKDGQAVVTVNNRPLDPRHDLRNHSPDGFSWGYGGSGPAQLALAILANECGAKEAQLWYQRFKWAVIARLPFQVWMLTSDTIKASLDEIKKVAQEEEVYA